MRSAACLHTNQSRLYLNHLVPHKIGKGRTGRAKHCSGNTTVLTKVATTIAENGNKRETQAGTAV